MIKTPVKVPPLTKLTLKSGEREINIYIHNIQVVTKAMKKHKAE